MKGEFFIIKQCIVKYIENIFTNSNDKILDIGSGQYPYYHKFMKGKIIAFDMENFSRTDAVGDANFLPFRKNSFDKVIMVNSIYYFRNPFKVIEDVSKILKKNGKLVIIAPFFYPIHDVPIDQYRFTEFGLKTILEDHLKVEKITPLGGFFNIPAVMLHSLIKGLPLLAPKALKNLTKILAYIAFYIPYILAQVISLLDFIDRTGRFPTYYIAVASKK
jgi:SAM-dependent methyltransferase